ncbi:hypothetical protein N665_0114s0014 [Sinapis alba]|nr:hypothetical protein N665_0114s0014 [Sinapis alba]
MDQDLDKSPSLKSSDKVAYSTKNLLNILSILNVTATILTALPKSIALGRSLVELDASFNNLPLLPTNIGYGLQNLERFSIQLKKHRYFLASLSEMHFLKYLDKHMNEINGIPNSIGRLTKLEVLNLSSNFNNLMGVPDSIIDLKKELDLSNNQISG